MTKKELYTCDVCHTDYANKEDAKKCEKEHLNCVEITDTRIHAHMKYPFKIAVKFSDDSIKWYTA